MSTEQNREMVRKAYESLGDPDSTFLDPLAEDFRWTFFGSHRFAGTYTGRAEILKHLFVPMFEVIESFRFRITNIVAEGDQVVVEGTGEAPIKTGGQYNNTYCIIVSVKDGKISEIREHLDSELVTAVFGR